MKTKILVTSLSLILNASVFFPARADDELSNSKKIEQAVRAFRPLALSGVDTHRVKPTSSVRSALLELALKTEYVSDESEFSWVGKSDDAWEADSTNFGETTMKVAYSYITSVDSDYVSSLDEEAKAKYKKNVSNAKKAFELLVGSGVKFGVVPMGAVQCGVTFAALAIIDPETGKIYVFAKEGSGC